MIPQPKLDELKRLIKAAAPPPLIVSQMDSRGQRFQLSTPRPGATIVGTAFKKADAELMAALWQWGALLIADLEQTVEVAKHYRNVAASIVGIALRYCRCLSPPILSSPIRPTKERPTLYSAELNARVASWRLSR